MTSDAELARPVGTSGRPAARSTAPAADSARLARALGRRLAELVTEPEAFVGELQAGLPTLAAGPNLGVPRPSLRLVERPVARAVQDAPDAIALWLAQRLIVEDVREVRLFALPALRRSLAGDPERSWQLLRRLGRHARDRVEVDSQASLWAAGVVVEPFRWAELEQLVYSDLPTERRLAAVAVASLPRIAHRFEREALTHDLLQRGLTIVRDLMGDAHPLVRSALAGALRAWARVDPVAVERLLRDETAISVEHGDGHRAVVIRDALAALPGAGKTELRARLRGIRSRPGAPSSSPAAARARAFGPIAGLSDLAVARQGARSAGG